MKHIIEFWIGYWEENSGTTNGVVGDINKLELKPGGNGGTIISEEMFPEMYWVKYFGIDIQ